MKRILLTVVLLGWFAASWAQIVPHDKLPPKPNPPRLVNDYANMLSDGERQQLETKLKNYDDSTSNQVVIVTVHSLQGYEADQYATEIGHYWGVGGQAKYDNGVIVLVSDGTEEEGKRKYFIATGYGLEGALPAITCNDIARQFLVPNLKSGNYFEAFDKTTDAIIQAAAGEYKPPENYRRNNTGFKRNVGGGFFFLFIIFIIIISIIRKGGGGGGMMSRRGSNWVTPFIIGSLLGRGSSNWGGGGGGSSGGGGGFGGFGGGDFGGGGSGGSW